MHRVFVSADDPVTVCRAVGLILDEFFNREVANGHSCLCRRTRFFFFFGYDMPLDDHASFFSLLKPFRYWSEPWIIC
jgi:hypothetical protein